MVIAWIVTLWASLGLIGLGLYNAYSKRQQTLERFVEGTEPPAETSSAASDRFNSTQMNSLPPPRRLYRRWAWVPWTLSLLVALCSWLFFRWPVQYVLAIGTVIALLLGQLERFIHTRHIALLERQLADAIDIMVGAVSAGAAVGPAIDAATMETARPLKPYLQDLSGRIRLGGDPATVFSSLSDRIPLETFLLFSSSLTVHYEVGGRLAPTLATVGRTIRDRIEVTRRIQSNIAQSQFSTFAILGLVYMIAAIVWRNNPDSMWQFVNSPVGSWFIAGTIILQAIGLAWMNLISKPKF